MTKRIRYVAIPIAWAQDFQLSLHIAIKGAASEGKASYLQANF